MIQEILKVLDDLLKIPSVSSDEDKLHLIVDYVEKYFSLWKNIHIQKYNFNNKPSIVIQNFQWKDADIMLNGHLDVVPSSEDFQFEPIYDAGRVFARWAGDMKSWVAIMMILMKNVLSQENFSKKVSLLLTSDEEVWWFDGANILVNEHKYTPKCVLIPDSWDIENIVIAEKGLIKLQIEVWGKSCHASRFWLGENAIEKTYHIYQEFRQIFHQENQHRAPHYWGSSVNMTMIHWWEASNMIPDFVQATFDIRVTEEFQNMQENKILIEKILQKFDAKILHFLTWDLLFTKSNDQYLEKYISCVTKTLKKPPHIVREHGASDGRFFASRWIPVILHRPTCWKIHAKWEYVEISAIEIIYNCYHEFIFW